MANLLHTLHCHMALIQFTGEDERSVAKRIQATANDTEDYVDCNIPSQEPEADTG